MDEGQEHLTALRCPKCGNDGSKPILLWEEGTHTTVRRVNGVADGLLDVGPWYDRDIHDETTNPMFECQACWHQWPVPDWVYRLIEWG